MSAPNSHTNHDPLKIARVWTSKPEPTMTPTLAEFKAVCRALIAASASDRDATLEEAAKVCDALANERYAHAQGPYVTSARLIRALKKAAPQVPSTATRGVGAAEAGSRGDDTLEPATSVQAPIASPVGAAPCVALPTEATDEMMSAGVKAFITWNQHIQQPEFFAHVWKAMLAAAPSAVPAEKEPTNG